MLSLILSIIILSYNPAPGQFINTLPSVTDDAAAAAQANLERGSLVCLGAAGGSITAKFDKPITNSHDYDITIYGNAFANGSEPGVIFVSYDENQNGIADDLWYEIAGSEYESTDHDYSITYYKPNSDTSNIRYRDSQGNEGFIYRNTFHQQPYYPSWVTEDSIMLRGALLPSNVNDVKGDGSLLYLEDFDYGYADNAPNSDLNGCSIKTDWAVDSIGNPANLPQVDFIRIQTGVLYCNSKASIGEVSTEVSAIHPTSTITSIEEIHNDIPEEFDAYTVSGQYLGHFTIDNIEDLKNRVESTIHTILLLKGKNRTYKIAIK